MIVFVYIIKVEKYEKPCISKYRKKEKKKVM